MKTLRELYIETGAITPAEFVRQVVRPVLRLDDAGRAAAVRHMEDESLAAANGSLCDIPLDQVPDFVLEAWERRERRHAV